MIHYIANLPDNWIWKDLPVAKGDINDVLTSHMFVYQPDTGQVHTNTAPVQPALLQYLRKRHPLQLRIDHIDVVAQGEHDTCACLRFAEKKKIIAQRI